MKRSLVMLGGILVLLGAIGCTAQPSQQVTLGDKLFSDDFSQPGGWDQYDDGTVSFGVSNGAYELRSNVSDYVRGFNDRLDSDVVIEASSRQFSTGENNAYGVMCRASRSDTAGGYYFLIGADGTYSIRWGRDDQIAALVAWTPSGAIHTGVDKNVIRAVCAGDYLAMYVNGEFLADTHDNRFTQGYIGFAVAVAKGGTIDVTFDDLTVWSASIAK